MREVPKLDVWIPAKVTLPKDAAEELCAALLRAQRRLQESHVGQATVERRPDARPEVSASRPVEKRLPGGIPTASKEPHDMEFATDDWVEYFSSSKQMWAPAKVIAVHKDQTGLLMVYDLDRKLAVKPHLIRAAKAPKLGSPRAKQTSAPSDDLTPGDIQPGMPVECFQPQFSGSWKWVEVVVTARTGSDEKMTIDVGCSNGQVLRSLTLDQLRLPSYCPRNGERVLYFSNSQKKWVKTRCLKVSWKRNQFEIDLDCKRAALLSCIRRIDAAEGETPRGQEVLPRKKEKRTSAKDAVQGDILSSDFLSSDFQDQMWRMLDEQRRVGSRSPSPRRSGRRRSPLELKPARAAREKQRSRSSRAARREAASAAAAGAPKRLAPPPPPPPKRAEARATAPASISRW